MAALLALALCGSTALAADTKITWKTSLREAQPIAAKEGKPIVVYFYGPWCSFCRRMEVSTFPDRAVTQMADRFVWVKIDIDQDRLLPALFGIQGVPMVIVFDANGRQLTERGGYLSPATLAEVLREAEQAKPPAVGEPAETLVAEVRRQVQTLADPKQGGRAEALRALSALGTMGLEQLLKLMNDEKLAVRAAAHLAIVEATGGQVPFDPFAASDARTEQIAAWRIWLANRASEQTTKDASHDTPTTQPASQPKTTSPNVGGDL